MTKPAFSMSRKRIEQHAAGVMRRSVEPLSPVPPGSPLPADALARTTPQSRTDILRYAVADHDSAAAYARDIAKLWREAQHAFLAIGRNLVRAKERLPRGEFERMVNSELPFGVSLAYQLRMIAEMIDTGRVQEAELPTNATTAYQLAVLSSADLAEARRAGLVRPDLKRPEIICWKRERARAALGSNSARVARERQRILRRLATLDEERARLEAQLAALGGAVIIEGAVTEEVPVGEA